MLVFLKQEVCVVRVDDDLDYSKQGEIKGEFSSIVLLRLSLPSPFLPLDGNQYND